MGDWAIGGVCFLRLSAIRPSRVPAVPGLRSENVAHRFAVEWDDQHGTQYGVYVPRRDTNSRVTTWAGGRVFPGDYSSARFDVEEGPTSTKILVRSRDDMIRLDVAARDSATLGGHLFSSVENAMDFFRQGARSYSPDDRSGCLAGVRLTSANWTARPATIEHMSSSLFDDKERFPDRSCLLDSALIMRKIPARWSNEGTLEPQPMGESSAQQACA